MVAAIVLAAGGSTRMGRPKSLLPIGSGTVLSTILDRVLRAAVDSLVLVLGRDAEAVRAGARLPDDPRLRVVVHARWADGMASTLVAGLEASLDADAVVILLGDQPGLDSRTLDRVVGAWRGGARIAAVGHADRVAHPVLFDRSLFGELRALRGDVGAREVLLAHAGEVVKVPGAPLFDLDTPADYAAFVSGGFAASDEGLDLP